MEYEKKTMFLLSLISIMFGFLFYCFYTGTLIIRPIVSKIQAPPKNPAIKKMATLYYWNNHNWQKETCDVLFSQNLATTSEQVIRSWLKMLDEEAITRKKITLQSVLPSSSNNELYISFDRNPLDKELAVYEKIMWVEGLLRTLRENDLIFCQVHLLVHHQPINDPHLDFSKSWPISGFIN